MPNMWETLYLCHKVITIELDFGGYVERSMGNMKKTELVTVCFKTSERNCCSAQETQAFQVSIGITPNIIYLFVFVHSQLSLGRTSSWPKNLSVS